MSHESSLLSSFQSWATEHWARRSLILLTFLAIHKMTERTLAASPNLDTSQHSDTINDTSPLSARVRSYFFTFAKEIWRMLCSPTTARLSTFTSHGLFDLFSANGSWSLVSYIWLGAIVEGQIAIANDHASSASARAAGRKDLHGSWPDRWKWNHQIFTTWHTGGFITRSSSNLDSKISTEFRNGDVVSNVHVGCHLSQVNHRVLVTFSPQWIFFSSARNVDPPIWYDTDVKLFEIQRV